VLQCGGEDRGLRVGCTCVRIVIAVEGFLCDAVVHFFGTTMEKETCKETCKLVSFFIRFFEVGDQILSCMSFFRRPCIGMDASGGVELSLYVGVFAPLRIGNERGGREGWHEERESTRVDCR